MDWLQVYDEADMIPFVEALDKTQIQYYPEEINMLKDAVSIPGIFMIYVLNKALKMKPGTPDLYIPGDPCEHKCHEECSGIGCRDCKQVREDCMICAKNKPYELLKKGMARRLSIVFSRYAEARVSKIRPHKYENPKTCASVIGFDANSLYLYCSGQEMPCSKEEYVEVSWPQDSGVVEDLCNKVLTGELFGFLQVNIHVPDALQEKFSKFSTLFIIDSIPEDLVPQHMKDYQERTGRAMIIGTKKLQGVMRATRILLYTPMLRWYLSHGLKVTAIHKYICYESGRPFGWFPKKVSKVRHNGDNDPALKQLGDTYKLKGNLFYGKMIEALMRHLRKIFMTNKDLVDQSFRSPYSEDLEEIDSAFKIKECKRRVNITRPYQCGIAVYQLAKLRMLEFYYNFLDKYLD